MLHGGPPVSRPALHWGLFRLSVFCSTLTTERIQTRFPKNVKLHDARGVVELILLTTMSHVAHKASAQVVLSKHRCMFGTGAVCLHPICSMLAGCPGTAAELFIVDRIQMFKA